MKNLVLILAVLLIFSCKKDMSYDLMNTNKSSNPNLVLLKSWYSSNTSTFSNSNENYIKSNVASVVEEKLNIIDINWDFSYLNHDSANIKSYTTPIKYDVKTGENIELVTSVINNNVKGVFIRYLPDSDYFSIHKKPGELKIFSGLIKIYDKNGNFLKSFNFKNGQKVDNKVQDSTKIFLQCDDCTLPDVIVSSSYSSNNYYYLMIIYSNFAYDLTPIFAGGGNISAGYIQDINVNITKPCISSVWNNIFTNAKQIQVMSFINTQFGFSENCNLNINDVPNLTNSQGLEVIGLSTFNRSNGSLTVNVSLNSSTDQSQESIAATILHEMIHAYIGSQNIIQTSEEIISNSNYVNWIKTALISLYPNLSDNDATALSLAGLENTTYYNSLDKSLTDSYKIIASNYVAGNLGTKCK